LTKVLRLSEKKSTFRSLSLKSIFFSLLITFLLISGGSFVPPPEVEVGVVSLTPLRQPYIQLPYETVDYVVNSLFLPGKNKYLR
jgi:16S rRNA A1518/A1519 N6-dimethyltransferase RsmA/KsgA/DIM1 with predicted DNA glycosylase/AP lyase activity